jgi:hypothetical protein
MIYALFHTALLVLAASFPAASHSTSQALPNGAASADAAQFDAGATTTSDGRGVVAAHSTDTWTLFLHAGVPATIFVTGDGDTDLDVFLYDENGNLIDSDTDLTDRCIVGVTPRWSGSFTLRVQNLGPIANVYSIRVRS